MRRSRISSKDPESSFRPTIFTDWQGARLPVAYIDDVIDGIVFDVENAGVWLDSWGPRPASADQRRTVVKGLANSAPRPIRLNGHRFLIEGSGLSPDPVISAVQTDFIVYASSIEESLAHDFPDFTVHQPVHLISEEARLASFARLREIGFWGEFLG